MKTFRKAPFPYFGSKRKVASIIWKHFGHNIARFVDPFCGSLAVPLAAPYTIHKRIFNDKNGEIINLWRAIKHRGPELLEYAHRPASTVEIKAAYTEVQKALPDLVARMGSDLDYYNLELAGLSCFGLSASIGANWLTKKTPNSRPNVVEFQGIREFTIRGTAEEYLTFLQDWIANSALLCGEWDAAVKKSILKHHASPTNLTAILFDPPYSPTHRSVVYGIYDDSTIHTHVMEWCIEHGSDPLLRIALCGYDEYETLKEHGWKPYKWTANIGMSTPKNVNRHREVIWFSPHCAEVTEPV